ncbi:hypothetical protein IAT38_003828 [Cryptococcus sp. DSM 104549]
MAPSVPPDGKIPCPTPQQLRAELEDFAYVLAPEEKEDTWEKFEKAVIRFSAVVRGGGYKHIDVFVEGLGRGGVGAKLVKCMLSDRGRLSGATTELLQTFAPRLGQAFKPLVHLYLEPLIELLGRPNKVFLKRSEKCLATIISHCHLPAIIPELRRGLDDNSAQCRKGCAVGLERAIKEWPAEVWAEKWLVVLEGGMKKMATDKDPDVRKVGKRVWALFNEFWPERVEEFSGPLTPTIRRYLDIPAANGAGPSRPKPARAAVVPPRPAPAPLSSSSGPSQKPQHTRVQALASRPLRAAPHPVQMPNEAGPSSRRAPGPVFNEEPARPSDEPYRAEPASRAIDPLPPVLGRHGRSMSHNTVPSSSNPIHNPLSKPVRPVLPSSFSTNALFTEDYGGFKPHRRLAPPERIARPQPVDEEGGEEEREGGVVGGGLRGAVRPVAGGRRAPAMGQAHRRAMTAPIPVATKLDGAAAKRELKLSARREESKGGEKSANALEGPPPAQVQPPLTSARYESFFSPVAAPPRTISADSPLMPVLLRSNSGDVKIDHPEGEVDADRPEEGGRQEASDGMINLQEEVCPSSPGPMDGGKEDGEKVAEITAAAELLGSPVRGVQEPEEQEAAGEEKKTLLDEQRVTKIEEVVEAEVPLETGDVELAVEEELTQEEVPKARAAMAVTTPAEVDEPVSAPPAASAPAATTSAPVPAPTARIPSGANSTKSTLPDTRPTLNAVPRKPPVPTARSAAAAARSVSGRTAPPVPVVRRTFKPTSLTAPTAASAARAATVNVSKPVPAPAVVSKPSVTTSTGGVAVANKAALAKSSSTMEASISTSKPGDNVPNAPKPEGKVTAKPALPAAVKPAAARVVSGAQKPAPPQAALPPVKKERIRLKAPLPSFRPQRANLLNTSASGPTSLKTSASSATNGRLRVRPEMVKLPDSPLKVAPAEVPLPPSPQEVPLPASPRSKAASISSMRSVHRASPLRPERTPSRAETHARSGSPAVPQSPITVAPPKPASPQLTTSDAEMAHLPPMPVFALQAGKLGRTSPKEEPADEAGAQDLAEDCFGSTATRAGLSSVTTRAPMSEDSEEEDDEMKGVTFKARDGVSAAVPGVATVNAEEDITQTTDDGALSPPPNPLPPTHPPTWKLPVNAFAPRSDVSTPQKSAAMLLAKLEGVAMTVPSTIERRALAVKDANTPNTVGRFDGDVSA